MYALETICRASWFLKIFLFVTQLLKIIFIIVPIGLIIMISVDLAKNVIDNKEDDMKKNVMVAIKRIIMAVVIFFVPTIVSFASNLVDGEVNYQSCIDNANPEMIQMLEEVEEIEKEQREKQRKSVTVSDIDSTNPYQPGRSGKGKGKALKITIESNVEDPEGRCGDGYKCQAIATVEYPGETVKYYMQAQNVQTSEGLQSGSCRAHAFTCIMNAINNTTYSTLDFQKYIETISSNTDHQGTLKAKEIETAIKHYNLDATVYHSETSYEECAKLIKEALDNGQPIMIFVAHSKCPDLAGTHHALFLLGYDENGNVLFIDSAGYYKNANGKRNIDELSQCISGSSISDGYYRMIIFNY